MDRREDCGDTIIQVAEEEASAVVGRAGHIRVPKHTLSRSGAYDSADLIECKVPPSAVAQSVPKLLKLVVELPSVKKSSDISLNIASSKICIEVPDKYYLDLPLPYEIDEDGGAAKFDKATQSLRLKLPVKPKLPDPSSNDRMASSCEAVNVESALTSQPFAEPESLGTSFTDIARPGHCDTVGSRREDDDDDDDDDMPPPLEAARSVPCKSSSEDLASDVQRVVDAAANLNPEDLADGEHTNEFAAALMQKALAAREQKRKETDEERKKADLASGGGLKKGFLSGGKSKNKTSATENSKASSAKSKAEVEDIPFITGASDPEAARRESLKLPEVQKALQEGTEKLKKDQSWVTPQLLQALGSRPDISKAMSDPRIQEAMQLMQTDPEAAKTKYKDDPEVTKFLKEFTGLMATHFEVLGKEAPNPPKPAPQPRTEPQKVIDAPLTGLDLSKPVSNVRPTTNGLPTDDPKIMALLHDPEVMALIAAIRSGQPLELHEIARSNERLFMKVKVLLDNGLLAMQH